MPEPFVVGRERALAARTCGVDEIDKKCVQNLDKISAKADYDEASTMMIP
jgi:hypothetical protein